jgi:hypothetical protein
MSSPRDILDVIRAFLDRHQASQVSYSQLLSHLDRYMMENPALDKVLEDLRRNTHKVLSAHLDALEQTNDVRLIRKDDTTIQSVIWPGYFMDRIRQLYERIEEKPELPYPNQDTVRLDIPAEDITLVDIKGDFMMWLNRQEGPVHILKINFPDGVLSMLATSDIIKTKVLTNAVHKMRHHLRDSKNMSYTRQKLTPLLKSRELAVKDMLHTIVTTPETAAATILDPTDFSFHLWTQLSSNIIKEYSTKSDKMAEEHAICQACYLIGYFNVFFRGQIQKRKEEETAFNVLMSAMRRPPWSFQISDIYELKDDKGILITKRLEKDRINDYIQDRLLPVADKDVPEFLRVPTAKGDEFFLLYASVPPLVIESLLRAGKEMREFYNRSWIMALRQDVEFTTMISDDEFRAHIQARLKNHYPLLHALLVYPILFFAARQDGIPESQRNELMDMLNINTQKVKPYDQLLHIQRKRLYDDARMLLPAWMVIPGLRGFVLLMRKLFLGKTLAERQVSGIFDHEGQERVALAKKKPAKGEGSEGAEDGAEAKGATGKAATAKQRIAQLRSAAKELESEFLPRGSQLQPTLENLLERWNTQIDPVSKQHLTEDVNALARDFLRRTKVTSKAKLPTAEDIKAYAQKLWESDSLLQIRNRKDLLRYLELYILHVLETLN